MASRLQRSYLKFKAGVVVPKVTIIAAAAVNAANEMGLTEEITITSGNDSTHTHGSLHYVNAALDIRTKTLPASQKQAWLTVLRRRLGSEYQVILEAEGKANEHAHVEYDPA